MKPSAATLITRLGSAVRALRISRDLTQAELADRANITRKTLSGLESGTGSTVETLLRVLNALDATDWIDQLTGPATDFNPFDVLEAQRSTTKGPLRVRRRK